MREGAGFYGQFGEDRLLAEIFAGREGLVCVDVGANDGITGSVSLHFEQAGWRCILVEPNPDLCERLRRERTSFLYQGGASSELGSATLMLAEGEELSHAVSSIEPGADISIARQGFSVRSVEVQTAPLDAILDGAGVGPNEIAFVSIDVEGHELEVLKGFTLDRWRPELLIIEDNSLFFAGGVGRHLSDNGYVRFLRTGVNDWYAAMDMVGRHSAHPERDYMRSMVRARALMLRRRIVGKLLDVPVAGPWVARLHRASRG